MSTSLQRNASTRSTTTQKKKTDGKVSPIELLEARCVLAAPQLLNPFTAAVSLRVGTALHLPLNGFDPEGDGITFSVTSDNPLIEAAIPQGNRSVRFTLNHESAAGFPNDPAFTDDFTVELLEDIAPNTAGRFADFVDGDFYNGLTFHRLVDGFAAQFGDPDGNGTGGTGTPIHDEFSKYGRHTSAGLLSTAKSFDDTFDTQAFLTQGNEDSTRFLDFNHTVFAAVTTFGETINFDDVELTVNPHPGISEVSFPVSPVTIVDAEVFVDEENGVLRLYVSNDVPVGTTANLTLTLTDSNGEFSTQNIQVEVAEDFSLVFGEWDDQPFFDPNPEPVFTDFDTPVSFTLEATDIEGDAIKFFEGSATDYARAGLSQNPALQVSVGEDTGEVTITPVGTAGVFSVLVKVEQAVDGSGEDFQVIPVIVNPPAPDGGVSFVSDTGVPDDGITNVNNTGGVPLQFRVEGQFIGVDIQLLADGELISQGTTAADGSLDFQLTGNDLFEDGTYEITARYVGQFNVLTGVTAAFAPFDLFGAETDPISITIDTRPVVFNSQPITTAIPGQLYQYDVSTDRDGESGVDHVLITYPEGMTIDPVTGLIQWTPAANQVFEQQVLVRVTDIAGNTNDQPYTIVVNTPPVLQPVADQTVAEETLLDLQIVVQDPDPGDVLSFQFIGAVPDGAAVDNTGRFTFTPTEGQGPGNYSVTVRVTDTVGEFDEVTFSIEVTEVPQPPVVQSVAPQFVLQGETLEFDVVASDDDLPTQTLIYSLDPGAPVGASIDPSTGRFTYNAPIDQPLGDVVVTIRVSDGAGVDALSATTSVTIDVVDDLPPVFLDQQTQFSTKASEPLIFDVLAVDPDPQPVDLLYSLEPGTPDFISIDPDTGRVTVTTTRQTPVQSVDFIVRVTEVGLEGPTTTKTFSVEITAPPNLPPEFPEQPMSFATQASVPLAFTVSAIDPDEVPVPLVFSIEPGAPDFVSIDPATGEVTVTTTRETPPQSVQIVVRVTEDSADELTETKSFSIEITDPPNLPPFFPEQPMQFSTKASELLIFDAVAEDPAPLDSDLVFSLEPGTPDFVTIDPDTGRVTVTTTRQTPIQTIDVVVRATEISSDELSATKTFTVEITAPPNLQPEFPEQPMSFTTQASIPLTFDVTAIDPDEVPVPLIYSLEPGTPAFVSIDPATGEVTVATTRDTAPQDLEIVVRVTEDRADALSETKSFSVEITEAPNLPPVFPDQLSEFSAKASETFFFGVIAEDPSPQSSDLVFSVEPGAPDFVTIDPDTGVVTVTTTRQTPPQSFEITVLVREVSDDQLSATKTFSVEITDPPNLVPEFPEQPMSFTTQASIPLTFDVTAIDPDEVPVPLIFSLEPGTPDLVTIDPSTGEVAVTTTRQTPPQTLDIVVRVTEDRDDALSATKVFTVEITPPPNDPPVFPDQQTDYTTEVGKLLTFGVQAMDPDPEQVPLSYSLEPGTPGIVSIDSTTGQVTVTTTRQTLPQTIQFDVRATETTAGGLSTTMQFTVELTPSTNQSPVIDPVAKQTVSLGSGISFGVVASDPDIPADPLVHSLSDNAPVEASIDPLTGEVTFTTTQDTVPGVYRFDVHVTEDIAEGLTATASVEVEVTGVEFRNFLGTGFSRFGPTPSELVPSVETDPALASLVGLFRSTSSSSTTPSSTEGLLERTAEGFSESPFNNITYGADTGLGRSAPREEGGEEESDGEKPKEENSDGNSEGVVPAEATEPVDESNNENEPRGEAAVEEEDKTPKAAVWDDRLIDWATAQHWAPGQDTFARTMDASVNRSRTASANADPYDIDLEPLVAPHMTVGARSDTGFNKHSVFESTRSSESSIILPAPGTEEEATAPVVEQTPVSDEVATVAAASMAFYMPLLVTDLPEAKKSRSRLRKWLGESD